MAGREDYRIFVGGLSWEVTERQLEKTFSRYGKVTETQIMVERETGRPRGFGFITFSDRRGMEDSIREMHGRELGDRIITVNKAEPKLGGSSEVDHGSSYRGSYTSGARGNFGGGGDRPVGQDECFKCGRLGHWARDCPSVGGGAGGGRGGGGPPFSRYGGGAGGGDRFGDRDRFIEDRFGERDRFDGGRFGERDRFDSSRDLKYGGGRDRFETDRYPTGGDRFASDRYGGGAGGGSARYPASNGFGRERGYERDAGPRGGVGDRYGAGGPARTDDRSYRSRAGPYERPNRSGRPSSFDRY